MAFSNRVMTSLVILSTDGSSASEFLLSVLLVIVSIELPLLEKN
jgi:hypothetical protein